VSGGWSMSGDRGLDGWRRNDVVSLRRRGHEIGCHTFSHLRVCDLDQASLAGEIARNRDYFHALDPAIEIDTSLTRSATARSPANPSSKTSSGLPQHHAGVNAAAWICSSSRHAADRRHIDRDGIERAFDDAETNNGW